MTPPVPAVKAYLLDLQDRICAALAAEDGAGGFAEDAWQRAGGGGGRTRILAGGAVFEKAGVSFSHVNGDRLPAAATVRRPGLAGLPWEALGVSVVIHPRNPYVPASHLNIRFFSVKADPPERDGDASWFGGGFDLTPCYGFAEDAVHWHRTAREAVAAIDPSLHPRFKQACDEYFFLAHRAEPRGIGGLFYDDFDELGFDRGFALARSVGDAYLRAYLPIVARRKAAPYGGRERRFQLHRRGRYAEFSLICDRGTLFGLQSGGRTDSILMSLPPLASWDCGWRAEPGSPEDRLAADFLRPRDWLSDPRI